jgi:tripartite-type tricarboxylate transporter receptor subunit TctC
MLNLVRFLSAPNRLSRRTATGVGLLSILFLSFCWYAPPARSQTYPDRTLHLVTGFGQGGPTDVAARVLADRMSVILGQPVIVESRPGASGNIATQVVANAAADGYTFLVAASPFAVNHWLFPDFRVKFGKDIIAVAGIGATSSVLVVNPSSNFHTLAEFKAYVTAHPGAVTYATVGKGTSSHLAGAAFDLQAGTKMLPVAYHTNGELVEAILGSHVTAWFATLSSVIELVRSGHLTGLAVTGPQRVASLPDIPTMAESGFPGFDVRLWLGLFAPAGTPADRIAVFETAFRRAMATPEMQKVFKNQGIEPMKLTRDQFTQFVNNEIARWKSVVDALN